MPHPTLRTRNRRATTSAIQAELIDIDFLWFLIDESYEIHQDGDLITFTHPRRGRLTAHQSERTALLIAGGFQDRRGLPATASVLGLEVGPHDTARRAPAPTGAVIPFQPLGS